MRAKEGELRGFLGSARLTLSFEDQPSEKVAIQEASGPRCFTIANLAAERAVRLYTETHPRPTQVTQTQSAEMLGVHPKTVRNYIVAGNLKLNGCRKIPIEAIDKLRSAL